MQSLYFTNYERLIKSGFLERLDNLNHSCLFCSAVQVLADNVYVQNIASYSDYNSIKVSYCILIFNFVKMLNSDILNGNLKAIYF